MATLLTKSSFCGGGWLTQKLRGLGEGVRSDGFISRTCFPTPTKAAPLMGHSPDPVSGEALWYPDPHDLNVEMWPGSQPQLGHRDRSREASDLGCGGMYPALAPGTSQGQEPHFVPVEIQFRGPDFSCLNILDDWFRTQSPPGCEL